MAESNPVGPRKVVLFSGHMIDAPGRKKPRFPSDKEAIAGAGDCRRSRRSPRRPG